jgi:protein TonB
MGRAPPAQTEADKPHLVETAPPPRPAEVATAPRPVTPPPSMERDPSPIASQSPAPRYPTQALRRGESGSVTVRAEIGADGVPTQVSVASSSGSRLLDRAAMDAVRRWRFTPATREGQPAPGTVVVPISFDATR